LLPKNVLKQKELFQRKCVWISKWKQKIDSSQVLYGPNLIIFSPSCRGLPKISSFEI
jgi:hypothetical protein